MPPIWKDIFPEPEDTGLMDRLIHKMNEQVSHQECETWSADVTTSRVTSARHDRFAA